MLLYDTLTRSKIPFSPRVPGQAGIYVCGPTVYDYAHIGHARSCVVYDVLVRHLRGAGLDVTYIRNVTDVDDKILQRAAALGEFPDVLAERYRLAYVEDMRRLGNLDPDVEPKVSDHISDVIRLIQTLLQKGYAYVVEGDVYFHVPAFPSYGKLSHRRLEDLVAGASGRLGEGEAERKRHPFDFALWKGDPGSARCWPSPWGEGRPGWHIECSAMSTRYLGESFDLHGGGLDLVFPHHENELAQSEAASGEPYSRCWVHNGFVQLNHEKMSKSVGNFIVVRELFDEVEPEAVRYALLGAHYRAPFNLECGRDAAGNLPLPSQFEEAERRIEYLYMTRQRLADASKLRTGEEAVAVAPDLIECADRLAQALNDDLNTPVALAHTAEFLSAVNHLCDECSRTGRQARASVDAAQAGFRGIEQLLGFGAHDGRALLDRVRNRRAIHRGIDVGHVEQLVGERSEARRVRDFARSDAIREELARSGVELCDAPGGTTWKLPG